MTSAPDGNSTTSGIITTTTQTRELSDGNGLHGGPGVTVGQSAADLVSLYGVTPVAQFAAPESPDVTVGAVGSTTEVFRSTTFPGATGSSDYSIGDIVTALKAIGILAA